MKAYRTLAVTAGAINTVAMFLAAITTDVRMLLTSMIGAGLSTYGWLYFTEEAESMGEDRTGYQSLAMRLRWEIKEESMQPGQKLPASRVLAEKHHTTRRTVMRAIHLLAEEGLIDVDHGRGCYVSGGGENSDRPKDRIEWHLTNNARQGDLLPTIDSLMELCGSSRTAVKRVVAELARKGVIRRQGSRYYRQ